MKLNNTPISRTCPEKDVFNKLLLMDNKIILELGCGTAEHTRVIASAGWNRQITALEVDEIQHQKNLLIDDLENVSFALGGAENIPAGDNSFDIVLMFKSLHHVPQDLMKAALLEIKRVLKPGGLAYISEPIFDGDLNEILRLFHNEQEVRESAFSCLQEVVEQEIFTLVEQVFFNTPISFINFEEYDQKVMQVTHSNHQIPTAIYEQAKQLFSQKQQEDGAHFQAPIRVDLLQKALL